MKPRNVLRGQESAGQRTNQLLVLEFLPLDNLQNDVILSVKLSVCYDKQAQMPAVIAGNIITTVTRKHRSRSTVAVACTLSCGIVLVYLHAGYHHCWEWEVATRNEKKIRSSHWLMEKFTFAHYLLLQNAGNYFDYQGKSTMLAKSL